MSKINGNDQILIIAATNRIEDMDEAILRRFHRQILVELPDDTVRLEV